MKKILIGLVIAILAVTLILFVACDRSSQYAVEGGSAYLNASDDAAYRKSESGNSVQKVILTTDRMMVYTVDVALTVEDYAATAASIRDLLTKAGGYEQSSYTSNDGLYRFTLRVPTTNLNNFLEKLAQEGTVEEQTVSGEDITDRYLSAEQERDALLAKKAAFEALAEQATTFDEQLKIQDKILEVAAEIDRYEDRLSDYKKSSDYSTVSITLYEEGTYEEPGFWAQLGAVFLGSGKSIGMVFGWILKAIVAIIPYTLLLAALFGLYALIRLIVCRAKKQPFTLRCSKAKRAAKKEASLGSLRKSTTDSPEPSVEKEEENQTKEE